jgi:hypothetical protein
VQAALNDVSICFLLPRGGRFWLYFAVAISLIAVVFSSINGVAMLFGSADEEVTWESILRETGMSIGHLWLFFGYRTEVLGEISEMREEARRSRNDANH